jgi:hypothetical protein
MAASATIQVYGVKNALKELNKINPALRRQITKDYKMIVSGMIAEAKSLYPNEPPISGMGRPYKKLGAWDNSRVTAGVIAKINTRSARNRNAANGAQYETIGTFIVYQKTGWGSIFDMAGRKTDSPFTQALKARFGSASRTMWPSYERHQEDIESKMRGLVETVMNLVGKNMID